MRFDRLSTGAAAVLALAACATSRQAAPRTEPELAQARAAAQAAQWTATLTPQAGGTVSGTATVGAGDDPQQTRATVKLAGADSGAVHPWHIHTGRCGDNGPIVGPAASYPPVAVGAGGTGTASATLPFAAPMSGSYYINVHRSSTEMGTIVACGNLTMAR